jgi:hypothetical protein
MVGSQPQQTAHETLCQKYPVQKRAGEVTQVVECLPSKHKTLSSSPCTGPHQKKSEHSPLSQRLRIIDLVAS